MADTRRSGATEGCSGAPASRRDSVDADEIRAIAHDLRQPAAAISALVAAARLQPGVSPDVRAFLDGIGREAQTISRLCRAFVERASTTTFRLDELVADVVARARLVFPTGIDVALRPVVVSGDEIVWQRMAGNLVENACRAAGASGAVKVDVAVDERGVVLEVADSGPGFGNAEPGLAGAGFAVVVRGTERHGGHVEIGRGALGGAAVRVVIPRSSAAVGGRVV